jgi:hypothetical protein
MVSVPACSVCRLSLVHDAALLPLPVGVLLEEELPLPQAAAISANAVTTATRDLRIFD